MTGASVPFTAALDVDSLRQRAPYCGTFSKASATPSLRTQTSSAPESTASAAP